MTITNYIKNNISKCIHFTPDDEGKLIGMPYPYIVPTMNSHFGEMYYWDTFFTNEGLFLIGQEELAKNNVLNMFYLIEKYGFMPNGNRTYYLASSQPPYLSLMVDSIYEHSKDINFLKDAYEILKKEYEFWQTQRITETGLNQHKALVVEELLDFKFDLFTGRVNLSEYGDLSKREITESLACDLESGWDFNPRCTPNRREFIWIDLNSNLYMYEQNFAKFAKILGNGEENGWLEKANTRKELINKYMFDSNVFLDYNFVQNKFSTVFSAASFSPLFARIATEAQAKSTVENLHRIEMEFGVSTCEKNDVEGNYQWDFPNAWPPIQYIVFKGLLNYGYKTDAIRIANKYINLVEKNFETTGTLWEKYNCVTGNTDVKNEYEMPAMLGWTSGVYLYFKNFIKNL